MWHNKRGEVMYIIAFEVIILSVISLICLLLHGMIKARSYRRFIRYCVYSALFISIAISILNLVKAIKG